MKIRLENIENYALRNVTVEFDYSKFSVILGPNGSGKTTLLNIIAGLVRHKGSVWFGDREVTHLSPDKRNVAYIFQGRNIFPHLTVYENIVFPLRIKKMGVKEEVLQDVIEQLNLGHLLKTYPANLSGGERQKVAIARTILYNPEIILMDEPFAALDLRTTKYLRNEMKFLQKKYGLTILFVTHNLYEAEELGENIYILNDGQILVNGTFEDIFYHKREIVEDIFGQLNIIDIDRYEKVAEGIARVYIGKLNLLVPFEKERFTKLIIDPKDIYISPYLPPAPHINLNVGKIVKIIKGRHFTNILVSLNGILFWSELPSDIYHQLSMFEGMQVYTIIKLSRIKIL